MRTQKSIRAILREKLITENFIHYLTRTNENNWIYNILLRRKKKNDNLNNKADELEKLKVEINELEMKKTVQIIIQD